MWDESTARDEARRVAAQVRAYGPDEHDAMRQALARRLEDWHNQPPSLTSVGREFVQLEDGSYRWIDIKRFWTPAGAVDGTAHALELLLAHPRYRDHYSSATSHDQDGVDVHGPYLLWFLSPDAFEPVDEQGALEVLAEFLKDEPPYSMADLPDHVVADIDFRVRRQIQRMPVRLRLRELGVTAQHAQGWILDPFDELVLVDLDRNELVVVVMAAD